MRAVKKLLWGVGAVLLLGMAAQPSQPTGGTYRAFSPSSEWNKRLPVNAPIHPKSARIIAELNSYPNGGYPRLTTGAWSEPIYFTDSSDRVGQVNCLPLRVRIPQNLASAATSDAQATVFDRITGVVYKVRSFTIDWNTNPVNVNAAGGCSVYDLTSNGLANSLRASNRDAPMNAGHRGYPPAIHGVRYDEVANGRIRHVLKVGLGRTAPCHVYPGAGHESGRGGVLTCEGLILRIKPSVNLVARGLTGGPLVIARAMKRYGVVIGDTSGVAMDLKMENLEVEGRTERWSTLGVTTDAFQGRLSFDDFQVIKAGYHRP
jgi:hypothetical protein